MAINRWYGLFLHSNQHTLVSLSQLACSFYNLNAIMRFIFLNCFWFLNTHSRWSLGLSRSTGLTWEPVKHAGFLVLPHPLMQPCLTRNPVRERGEGPECCGLKSHPGDSPACWRGEWLPCSMQLLRLLRISYKVLYSLSLTHFPGRGQPLLWPTAQAPHWGV